MYIYIYLHHQQCVQVTHTHARVYYTILYYAILVLILIQILMLIRMLVLMLILILVLTLIHILYCHPSSIHRPEACPQELKCCCKVNARL